MVDEDSCKRIQHIWQETWFVVQLYDVCNHTEAVTMTTEM